MIGILSLQSLVKSRLGSAVIKLIILTMVVTPLAQVFSYPSIAHAAFNKQINYQGKLTDSSNIAVSDGTYHMKFRLYTAATGGTLLAEEDRSTAAGDRVQVTNGLFSVMIGSSTSLENIDFNQTLYLEVEIGGTAGASWETLSPRKILGAVPAAFVSDTVDGVSSEQFLRADATNSTSTASTFLNIIQSGAGDIAQFTGANSVNALTIKSNGNIGIGTSSPYAKLSVVGQVVGEYFTATSTSATSTFPKASVTSLGLGSDYVTDITGSNLTITNGSLGVTATPAFTSLTTTSSISASGSISAGGGFSATFASANNFAGGLTVNKRGTTGDANAAVVSGSEIGYHYFKAWDGSAYGNASLIITSATEDWTGTNHGAQLSFRVTPNGSTSMVETLRLAESGQVYVPVALRIASLNGPLHANAGVVSATSSIGVLYGGTGLTTAPSYGQLLLGNSSGGYTLTATSSLGLASATQIGSGTTGQFPYYAANGTTLSATSSIFVSTSGAIGIGTTTPTRTLDVYSTLNNYAAQITNGFGGSNAGGLLIKTSDGNGIMSALQVDAYNATGWFTVKNPGGAGIVGIATSTPTARFAITANGTGTGRAFAIANSSNAEKFTILDNGNVGIGTTSPYLALGVVGSSYMSGTITAGNNITATGAFVLQPSSGSPGYGNTSIQLDATNFNTVINGTMAGGSDYFKIRGTSTGDAGILEFVTGDNGDEPMTFSQQNGSAQIERMRISSTGNLGVGTSTPFGKLAVGSANASSVGPLFTVASSSSGVATTTAFLINGFGNVGIGTSSPSALLAVSGSLGQGTGITFAHSNGTQALQFGYSGISKYSNNGANNLQLDGYSTGHVLLQTNGGSGNVGIGTTTPGAALNVLSATSPQVRVSYDGTNYATFGVNSSGTLTLAPSGLNTSVSGSLAVTSGVNITGALGNGNYFQVNGTTGLIYNGTNVGIGTSTPGSKFSIAGAAGGTTPLFMISTSTSGFATTTTFLVDANGNVGVGTVGPDRKVDILDSTNAQLRLTQTDSTTYSDLQTDSNGYLKLTPTGGRVVINTTYLDTQAATILLGTGGFGGAGDIVFRNTGGIDGTISPVFKIKDGVAALQEGLRFSPTWVNSTPGSMSVRNRVSALGTYIFDMYATEASSTHVNFLGNVGVGTSSPWKALSVTGDLSVTGAFFDSTASAGSNGYVLQTTGSGTSWVATSTLGFASASQIGSGTTGQFPYYAANGTDLTATSSLYISTAGNIGVGTTSPSNKLEVNGSATIGSSDTSFQALYFKRNGTITGGIGNGNGILTLWGGSSAVNHLMINASGNVGIGNPTPLALLDVAGSARAQNITASSTVPTIDLYDSDGTTDQRMFRQTIAGNLLTFDARNDSAVQQRVLMSLQHNTGNIGIGTTSQTARLTINAGAASTGKAFNIINTSQTETFTVLDNGNIGIGTSSPAQKLHVLSSGAGQFTGLLIQKTGATTADEARIDFSLTSVQSTDASPGGARIGAVRQGANAMSDLYFSTNNSGGSIVERMRLTSGGNVGIGTSSPTKLLHIEGSSATAGALGSGTVGIELKNLNGESVPGRGVTIGFSGALYGSTGRYAAIDGLVTGSGGSGQIGALVFSTKAAVSDTTLTERMRVDSNGNIGIGTSSPLARLDVAGANNGTSPLFQLSSVSSFATTTRFMVTNAGNVGIGTTTPGWLLGVAGTIGATDFAYSTEANASAQKRYNFTRTVPTTVGDSISLASTTITNGAQSYFVSVTVPSTGFSVTKHYLLPIQYNQTNGVWQEAAAISSTGSYSSQDFALDIRVTTNTADLRIRRTQGTTAGTATVNIESLGAAITLTQSSYTETNSVPTARFGSTALTQVNGNVGIGTTTPTYRLSVYNTASAASFTGLHIVNDSTTAGSSVAARLGVYNGNNGLIIEQSSNATGPSWASGSYDAFIRTGQSGSKLHLGSNNASSPEVTISAGNVGIGTTSPAAKLTIREDSSGAVTTGIYLKNNTAVDGGVGIDFDNSTANTVAARIASLRTSSGDFGTALTFSTIGTSGEGGALTEKMRITSGGNIGIGSTSPTAMLTIERNTAVNTPLAIFKDTHANGYTSIQLDRSASNRSNTIRFTQAGTAQWHIGNLYNGGTANTTLSIVNSSSAAPDFGSATAGINITSAGSVGIGTTTPGARLSIAGSAGGTTPLFMISTSTAAFGTSTALTVDSNGAVIVNGTSAGSASTVFEIKTSAGSGFIRAASTGGLSVQMPSTYGGGTGRVALASNYSEGMVSLQDSSGNNHFTIQKDTSTMWAFGPQVAGNGINFYASSTVSAVLTGAGNFGIGTSSPLARLDVAGANNGTTPLFQVSSVASFATTTRFLIDSAGNVGVGTTSPWKTLSVTGDLSVTGAFFDSTASAGSNGYVLQTTGSGTQWVATSTLGFASATQIESGTQGQVPFYNAAGTDLSATSTIFIGQDAEVGIGTASPASKFHVVGASDSAITALFQRTASAIQNNAIVAIHSSSTATGVLAREPEIKLRNFDTTTGNYTSIINYNSAATVNSGIDFLNVDHTYKGAIRFVTRNAVGEYGERMRINELGNVGIGTTSPYTKLGVAGGIVADSIYATSTTATNYFAGNVGIGTTTPGAKLDISASDSQTATNALGVGALLITNTNNTTNNFSQLLFRTVDSSGNTTGSSGILGVHTSHGATVSGDLAFVTKNSGTLSEKMRITAGGNVGIGTTTPGAKLQAVSTTEQLRLGYDGQNYSTFTVNSDSDLTISNSSATGDLSLSPNAVLYLGTSLTDNILVGRTDIAGFYTAISSQGGETMRVTNGMVGIGTSTPYAKLSVSGSSATTTMALRPASGQTANILDIYSTSGALASVINASGNVGIGTTSPYTKLGVEGQIVSSNIWATSSTAINYFGGNVGIGISSPASLLHISQSASSILQSWTREDTSSTFSLNNAGNDWRLYGNSNADDFIFGVDPSNVPTVGGSVAIGMGDPQGKFHVKSVASTDITSIFQATTSQSVDLSQWRDSSANVLSVVNSSGNFGIGTTTAYAKLSIAGSAGQTNPILSISTSTAGFSTTTALLINSNGNVGIGTTSPRHALTVDGLSPIFGVYASTNGRGITIDPASGAIDSIGSALSLNRFTANPVSIGFSSAAHLRVGQMTESGTFGATALLYVGNTETGTAGLVIDKPTGGTADLFDIRSATTTIAGDIFTVKSSGNVGIGTTSPWAKLAINPVAGDGNSFVIGSSTATKLIVTNSGNVGIGTTSPVKPLDVYGDIRSTGIVQSLQGPGGSSYMFSMDASHANGPRLQLGTLTNSSQFFEVGAYSNQNNFDSKTRDLQLFGTGVTGLMIKATTGNVGIGTTSPYSRLAVWGASTGNIFEAITSASSTALAVSGTGFGTTTLTGLNIDGSATTTSNVGFNITAGCFAVNGTCVGSGGSSQWTTTGNDIYYTTGNVGIGTTSPSTKLHISGTGTVKARVESTDNTSAYYELVRPGATSWRIGNDGNFRIDSSSNSFSTVATTPFFINTSGNVGIGSTTPGSVLSVNGSGYFAGTLKATSSITVDTSLNNSDANLYLKSANAGWATLTFRDATGDRASIYATNGLGMYFNTGSSLTTKMALTSGGNLGIGTTSPYARLSVVGSVVAANYIATTTATSTFAGGLSTNLLSVTSTTASSTFANGINLTAGCFAVNGTCVGSGGSSQWTTTGSDIYYTTGNVGIGTTSPISKFAAVGNSVFDLATSDGTFKIITSEFQGASSTLKVGGYAGGPAITSSSGIINIGDESVLQTMKFIGGGGYVGASISPTQVTFSGTTTIKSDGGTQENFIITNTGNVGIGTSTPAERLSLKLGSDSDVFKISRYSSSGRAQITLADQNGIEMWRFGAPAAGSDTFHFYNGANRLSINSDGNVGVGSSSPNTLFAVSGTSTLQHVLPSGPITNNLSQYSLGASDQRWNSLWAGTLNVGTSTWSLSQQNGNRLSIFDAANSGGSETFTILNGGNVGIGTTSPYSKFAVDGNVAVKGDLRIGTTTNTVASTTPTFQSDPGSTDTRNDHTGTVGFTFQVSQAITIYELGRHYISGNSQDHVVKLWVSSDTSNPLASVTVLAASASDANGFKYATLGTPVTLSPGSTYAIAVDETNGGDIWKQDWNPSGVMSALLTNLTSVYSTSHGTYPNTGVSSFEIFGAPVMKYGDTVDNGEVLFASVSSKRVGVGTVSPQRVLHVYTPNDEAPVRFQDSSGYCEINPTTTTWSCTSDARLKKDIVALTSTTTLDAVMKLRPVTFAWNKDKNTANKRYGLIAQEVEQIYPEFVTTDEKGFKSVSYGSLTPILISAIQEQSVQINTLNTRFAALESDATFLREIKEAFNATSTGTTTPGFVNKFFASIGAKVNQGSFFIQNIFADTITIGSPTKQSMISIFDKSGKEGCMLVDDVNSGNVKVLSMPCAQVASTTVMTVLPAVDQTTTQTGNNSTSTVSTLPSTTSTTTPVTSTTTPAIPSTSGSTSTPQTPPPAPPAETPDPTPPQTTTTPEGDVINTEVTIEDVPAVSSEPVTPPPASSEPAPTTESAPAGESSSTTP